MAANVPSAGINNLVTLIKRLEAATSRLEDMATSIDSSHPAKVDAITNAAAAPSGAAGAAAAEAAPTPEPLPPAIEDYDKFIQEEVASFVAASGKVDTLLEDQAKAFLEAIQISRTWLLVSTKAKKPDTPVPKELETDLNSTMGPVQHLREENRSSPFFNNLSAVSEAVFAVPWILQLKPGDFVSGVLESVDYYGNQVRKAQKDKDQKQVDWVASLRKMLQGLVEYVNKYHKMGVIWNNKDGINYLEALNQVKAGKAAPAAVGGAPPPPPPPPPLPTFDAAGGPPPPPLPAASASKGSDMGAVFDQINQGSSVTSGLRKVDKSEMTHKNPSLRAGSTVPERSSSVGSSSSRGKSPLPSKKPKPEAMRTKKPPKKELDGSKWLIENFESMNQSEIIEINAEISHSILISRCTKSIVKVNGKANAISIDNCSGLSILIDSLVSSVDVIKSPKFQLQVDGVLPTIMLDQVDGAQIYLSAKSLGTEVFTSKCSSINVVLPPSDESGDDKEVALPEQIKTYIKNGKLISEIVEHAG